MEETYNLYYWECDVCFAHYPAVPEFKKKCDECNSTSFTPLYTKKIEET